MADIGWASDVIDPAAALPILRQDLQNPPQATDEYLAHLLSVAESRISDEGIILTGSIDDLNLVVMYASWLYRCRNKDDNPMPRMLRWALNNRLFGPKREAIL